MGGFGDAASSMATTAGGTIRNAADPAVTMDPSADQSVGNPAARHAPITTSHPTTIQPSRLGTPATLAQNLISTINQCMAHCRSAPGHPRTSLLVTVGRIGSADRAECRSRSAASPIRMPAQRPRSREAGSCNGPVVRQHRGYQLPRRITQMLHNEVPQGHPEQRRRLTVPVLHPE
jgi:hypothetical protein